MSLLTFTLRSEPDQRLDLSPLLPHKLAGLSQKEIAAIELHTTRQRVSVGDVFKILLGDASSLRFVGGSSRLDWLGHGMSTGSIEMRGDVGAQAGRLMSGGAIAIFGSAGPFAASGLAGGMLRIEGDAGDCLGAPGPGEMQGIAGGVVEVTGNVGERAGERMRRGLLIVGRDAGACAGARMIAGTLIICGKAGRHPGALMQRGTIILGAAPAEMLPGFVDCGPQDLVFTRLLERALAPVNTAAAALLRRPLRRLAGDMSQLGKGEILLPA